MSFNLYAMEQKARTRVKNQKVVMKKERFRKQDKTKKCSFCKFASVKTIPLGKTIRRLCGKHLAIYNNKNESIKPSFTKASDL